MGPVSFILKYIAGQMHEFFVLNEDPVSQGLTKFTLTNLRINPGVLAKYLMIPLQIEDSGPQGHVGNITVDLDMSLLKGAPHVTITLSDIHIGVRVDSTAAHQVDAQKLVDATHAAMMQRMDLMETAWDLESGMPLMETKSGKRKKIDEIVLTILSNSKFVVNDLVATLHVRNDAEREPVVVRIQQIILGPPHGQPLRRVGSKLRSKTEVCITGLQVGLLYPDREDIVVDMSREEKEEATGIQFMMEQVGGVGGLAERIDIAAVIQHVQVHVTAKQWSTLIGFTERIMEETIIHWKNQEGMIQQQALIAAGARMGSGTLERVRARWKKCTRLVIHSANECKIPAVGIPQGIQRPVRRSEFGWKHIVNYLILSKVVSFASKLEQIHMEGEMDKLERKMAERELIVAKFLVYHSIKQRKAKKSWLGKKLSGFKSSVQKDAKAQGIDEGEEVQVELGRVPTGEAFLCDPVVEALRVTSHVKILPQRFMATANIQKCTITVCGEDVKTAVQLQLHRLRASCGYTPSSKAWFGVAQLLGIEMSDGIVLPDGIMQDHHRLLGTRPSCKEPVAVVSLQFSNSAKDVVSLSATLQKLVIVPEVEAIARIAPFFVPPKRWMEGIAQLEKMQHQVTNAASAALKRRMEKNMNALSSRQTRMDWKMHIESPVAVLPVESEDRAIVVDAGCVDLSSSDMDFGKHDVLPVLTATTQGLAIRNVDTQPELEWWDRICSATTTEKGITMCQWQHKGDVQVHVSWVEQMDPYWSVVVPELPHPTIVLSPQLLQDVVSAIERIQRPLLPVASQWIDALKTTKEDHVVAQPQATVLHDVGKEEQEERIRSARARASKVRVRLEVQSVRHQEDDPPLITLLDEYASELLALDVQGLRLVYSHRLHDDVIMATLEQVVLRDLSNYWEGAEWERMIPWMEEDHPTAFLTLMYTHTCPFAPPWWWTKQGGGWALRSTMERSSLGFPLGMDHPPPHVIQLEMGRLGARIHRPTLWRVAKAFESVHTSVSSSPTSSSPTSFKVDMIHTAQILMHMNCLEVGLARDRPGTSGVPELLGGIVAEEFDAGICIDPHGVRIQARLAGVLITDDTKEGVLWKNALQGQGSINDPAAIVHLHIPTHHEEYDYLIDLHLRRNVQVALAARFWVPFGLYFPQPKDLAGTLAKAFDSTKRYKVQLEWKNAKVQLPRSPTTSKEASSLVLGNVGVDTKFLPCGEGQYCVMKMDLEDVSVLGVGDPGLNIVGGANFGIQVEWPLGPLPCLPSFNVKIQVQKVHVVVDPKDVALWSDIMMHNFAQVPTTVSETEDALSLHWFTQSFGRVPSDEPHLVVSFSVYDIRFNVLADRSRSESLLSAEMNYAGVRTVLRPQKLLLHVVVENATVLDCRENPLEDKFRRLMCVAGSEKQLPVVRSPLRTRWEWKPDLGRVVLVWYNLVDSQHPRLFWASVNLREHGDQWKVALKGRLQSPEFSGDIGILVDIIDWWVSVGEHQVPLLVAEKEGVALPPVPFFASVHSFNSIFTLNDMVGRLAVDAREDAFVARMDRVELVGILQRRPPEEHFVHGQWKAEAQCKVENVTLVVENASTKEERVRFLGLFFLWPTSMSSHDVDYTHTKGAKVDVAAMDIKQIDIAISLRDAELVYKLLQQMNTVQAQVVKLMERAEALLPSTAYPLFTPASLESSGLGDIAPRRWSVKAENGIELRVHGANGPFLVLHGSMRAGGALSPRGLLNKGTCALFHAEARIMWLNPGVSAWEPLLEPLVIRGKTNFDRVDSYALPSESGSEQVEEEDVGGRLQWNLKMNTNRIRCTISSVFVREAVVEFRHYKDALDGVKHDNAVLADVHATDGTVESGQRWISLHNETGVDVLVMSGARDPSGARRLLGAKKSLSVPPWGVCRVPILSVVGGSGGAAPLCLQPKGWDKVEGVTMDRNGPCVYNVYQADKSMQMLVRVGRGLRGGREIVVGWKVGISNLTRRALDIHVLDAEMVHTLETGQACALPLVDDKSPFQVKLHDGEDMWSYACQLWKEEQLLGSEQKYPTTVPLTWEKLKAEHHGVRFVHCREVEVKPCGGITQRCPRSDQDGKDWYAVVRVVSGDAKWPQSCIGFVPPVMIENLMPCALEWEVVSAYSMDGYGVDQHVDLEDMLREAQDDFVDSVQVATRFAPGKDATDLERAMQKSLRVTERTNPSSAMDLFARGAALAKREEIDDGVRPGAVRGTIPRGGRAHVHSLEPTHGVSLRVRPTVGEWRWSDLCTFSGRTEKCVMTHRSTGVAVELLVEAAQITPGAWLLRVYCPYWVVNLTELPVAIAPEGALGLEHIYTPLESTVEDAVEAGKALDATSLFSPPGASLEPGTSSAFYCRFKMDKGWSSNSVNLDDVGTPHDVYCPHEDIVRGLGVTIADAPGRFYRTRVITLTARHVFVNHLPVAVCVSDEYENNVVEPHGHLTLSWHEGVEENGPLLRVGLYNMVVSEEEQKAPTQAVEEQGWVSVDLRMHQVSRAMCRPFQVELPGEHVIRLPGEESVFALVCVSLEKSSFVIELSSAKPPIRVRNECASTKVTFSQAFVRPLQLRNAVTGEQEVVSEAPTYEALPGGVVGYAWDDPLGKKELLLTAAGCGRLSSQTHRGYFKVGRADDRGVVPRNDTCPSIVVEIRNHQGVEEVVFRDAQDQAISRVPHRSTGGYGNVWTYMTHWWRRLKASYSAEHYAGQSQGLLADVKASDMGLVDLKWEFRVKGVAVSIVDDTPNEIMYVEVSGAEEGITTIIDRKIRTLVSNRDMMSVEWTADVELYQLRVDDCRPDSIHPVLVRLQHAGSSPAVSLHAQWNTSVLSMFDGRLDNVRVSIEPVLEVALHEPLVHCVMRFVQTLFNYNDGGDVGDPWQVSERPWVCPEYRKLSKLLRDPVLHYLTRSDQGESRIEVHQLEIGDIRLQLTITPDTPGQSTEQQAMQATVGRYTPRSATSMCLNSSGLVSLTGTAGLPWGVAIFLQLGAMRGAGISFKQIEVDHQAGSYAYLGSLIGVHYQRQLAKLLIAVGRLDLLGNPLGTIYRLGDAVAHLSRGDVGSFSRLGTGAISDFLMTLSSSMSSLTARATLDDKFKEHHKSRERRDLTTTSPLDVVDNVVRYGVLGGVWGVFQQTYGGAQEGGAIGAMAGLGKGSLGLVFRPVTTVLDTVSDVMRPVLNTVIPETNVRVMDRLPLYIGVDHVVRSYEESSAVAQAVLRQVSKYLPRMRSHHLCIGTRQPLRNIPMLLIVSVSRLYFVDARPLMEGNQLSARHACTALHNVRSDHTIELDDVVRVHVTSDDLEVEVKGDSYTVVIHDAWQRQRALLACQTAMSSMGPQLHHSLTDSVLLRSQRKDLGRQLITPRCRLQSQVVKGEAPARFKMDLNRDDPLFEIRIDASYPVHVQLALDGWPGREIRRQETAGVCPWVKTWLVGGKDSGGKIVVNKHAQRTLYITVYGQDTILPTDFAISVRAK